MKKQRYYKVVGAMEDRIKKAILKEKQKEQKKKKQIVFHIIKRKSLKLTKEYQSTVS